ncbi:MAG: hypothetical protein M3494_02535 [Actinomycetota bacterium]|nr:hypothetical protein [Actinomycetota bacterium]
MKSRGSSPTGMYRKRRFMAIGLAVLGAAALLFALLAPTTASGDDGRTVPIDPASAAPETVLATVGGVDVSTPIRPSALTGLGYHPEGESLSEMEPRGDNLSGNPLLALIPGGSTPESIRYHVMDSAGREGAKTGALDVGAPTETNVYSPVTGSITSIRPDPAVADANIVEIQPTDNPDLRVTVSLVESDSDSAGVNTPVTAGETKLGLVADSAGVLDPQLAEYTGDAGNHVTVAVSNVG